MEKVTCLLIRHGKTKGNIEKRYIGCMTDEELCDAGIAELDSDKLADLWPYLYEKVFVSPLKRCRQTAEVLLHDRKQSVIDDFKEIAFGEFENKNYIELQDNPAYREWLDSGGRMAFPGGESRETFITRTVEAFYDIITKNTTDYEKKVLPFVIHGGNIMAIMSSLTGEDYYKFQIDCGDGYIVNCRVNEEKINVISYNRISCRSDA